MRKEEGREKGKGEERGRVRKEEGGEKGGG